MNFRAAFRTAIASARANLLPGLLLQSLMVVFLSLYVAHEGTRAFLNEVAGVKQEAGFAFAFVSYVLAAALLPELLRIAFFQDLRPRWQNLRTFVVSIPFWGFLGVLVDFFYRCQQIWFGTGSDFITVLLKLCVDQFLFSPLVGSPLTAGWFVLLEGRFHKQAWRSLFTVPFLLERAFPVQVAGWLIWIPGVALVYFMPSLLQIPVAVLIQAFWVLIVMTVGEKTRRGKS